MKSRSRKWKPLRNLDYYVLKYGKGFYNRLTPKDKLRAYVLTKFQEAMLFKGEHSMGLNLSEGFLLIDEPRKENPATNTAKNGLIECIKKRIAENPNIPTIVIN